MSQHFQEASEDTTQLAAMEIAARRGGMAAAHHRGAQIVHFYKRLVEDPVASAAAGRPKFRELNFVKIVTPGNVDHVDREVYLDRQKPSKSDDLRFPAEWASFQARGETIQEGTPLAAVPSMSRVQVEELRHFHIVTVEQLAQADDLACQRFFGLTKLRQWARDYLEAASSGAGITRLSRHNEQLENDVQTLHRQVQELTAALAALQKVSPETRAVAAALATESVPPQKPQEREPEVPTAPRRLRRPDNGGAA